MADSAIQSLLGLINRFRGKEPTATGTLATTAGQALPATQPDLSQRPLYEQGLARFLNNDKAGAAGFWQKALQQDPGNKEAKRGMARLAPQPMRPTSGLYEGGLRSYLRGDHNTAASLWQQALQVDPGDEEARNGLMRLGGNL